MIRPSRLFLALGATVALTWKLDTASRWCDALAPTSPQDALQAEALPPVPSLDSTKPLRDTAQLSDPFGTLTLAPTATVPRPGPSRPAPIPPGPRPWKLMGLVGTRSAILANGEKTWVVGSGEHIGNLRVVSIGATGVTLEDEAGTWTLATSR